MYFRHTLCYLFNFFGKTTVVNFNKQCLQCFYFMQLPLLWNKCSTMKNMTDIKYQPSIIVEFVIKFPGYFLIWFFFPVTFYPLSLKRVQVKAKLLSYLLESVSAPIWPYYIGMHNTNSTRILCISNKSLELQNVQGMAWELSGRLELCNFFPHIYSFLLLVHSHFYHNQFTISLLKSSSFRFTPCWISASSGSSNFCISELNCSNSFKGMEA